MKSLNIYFILVAYFIFLLFRKIMSSIVEYKLPTYKDLDKQTQFWKTMVLIRRFLVVVDVIFIIFLLTYYKFNIYFTVIFYLFLLADIEYFLFDERYINYFNGYNNINNNFIKFMDVYGDNFNNVIELIFCFYVIYFVFINRNNI